MRYSGRDGKFGPLDNKLINDAMGNPLGVDRNNPDGKDDIMVPRMAVPVNRQIEVLLRTKDVIHDFFVPELRIKLDTVPGLIGKLRFKPRRWARTRSPARSCADWATTRCEASWT